MNRSRLPIVLLAATVLACLALPAASARPSRYGGVLTIGLSMGYPDTLDPTLSQTFSAVEIYRSFCERLYDFDQNSHIFPELASALPRISKDRLT